MVQLTVIGFCFSKLETQWNTQIEYWDIFILVFKYVYVLHTVKFVNVHKSLILMMCRPTHFNRMVF